MKKHRETIVIFCLGLCLCTTLGFFAILRPEVPAPLPPTRGAHARTTDTAITSATMADDNWTSATEASRYIFLGKKPIFKPLIAKPTPAPTPIPPPTPLPKIDAVLKEWKLVGVDTGSVEIQQGEEIFTFRLGDTRDVEVNNLSLPVVLTKIDTTEYKVTFRAPEHVDNAKEEVSEWKQLYELKF